MRRTAALLLLGLACTPAVVPPASTPPPPPIRPENVASATGTGARRRGAARPAHAGAGVGGRLVVPGGGEGVRVWSHEADSGRQTVNRFSRPPSAARRPLTHLSGAINTRDQAAIEELALYSDLGLQQLYTHLGETQRHLRTVVDLRLVSDSGGRFVYELRGHREPPVQVTVSQDVLTRLTFSAQSISENLRI